MEELQNVISGPQEEKKATLLSVSYLNIFNIGENTRVIPDLLRSFCSLLFDLHTDFLYFVQTPVQCFQVRICLLLRNEMIVH